MNDGESSFNLKNINFPHLICGLIILSIYLFLSRNFDPFNFLETYKDFTPKEVVKIKWYMWLLPLSFFLISYSLAKSLGSTIFSRVDSLVVNSKRNKFLVLILIISLIEVLLISYFVMDGLPHFLDEVVYYFQAKVFAGGNLYAPSPPKEFFNYLFLYNGEGKWFARHFPGFSLILSLGVILNVERFVNPLLSTFTILIFYFLLLNICKNERVSRYSILLILVSPFYPFMSASFMSHPASMFLSVTFIFCLFKTLKSDKLIFPVLLGFFLGFEYITRPITFTAMALPYAFYCAYLLLRGKLKLLKVVLVIIPLALWASFFFYYNNTLTGDMLTTPMQIADRVHFGFGPNEGIPNGLGGNTGFTAMQALFQMKSKFVMLGVDLFGWGGFSLIFLPFFLFHKSNNKWDYLFFANFILITLTYFIAHNRGMMYGARYYFCLLPFLCYFTVKGILVVIELLQRKFSFSQEKNKSIVINSVIIFVLLFFLRSFTEYMPMKVDFYSSLYPTRTMYKIIEEHELSNALVFVNGTEAWIAGLIANSPYLDTDIIYAQDLKSKNIKLMRLYPEKTAYLFDYNLYKNYGYLVKLDKNAKPIFKKKMPKLKVINGKYM